MKEGAVRLAFVQRRAQVVEVLMLLGSELEASVLFELEAEQIGLCALLKETS